MNEYQRLNHIEKMDLIDKNNELSEQLYEKFKIKNACFESDFNNIPFFEEKFTGEELISKEKNNQVNNLILESLVEYNKKKRIQETRIN